MLVVSFYFTLSSETLSFGALASQGHAGFAGQTEQGSGFNFATGGSGGTGFGTPSMYVKVHVLVHIYTTMWFLFLCTGRDPLFQAGGNEHMF